jgi:hypothetical protein
MLNPKWGGGCSVYVLLSLLLAGLGWSADGDIVAADGNNPPSHAPYYYKRSGPLERHHHAANNPRQAFSLSLQKEGQKPGHAKAGISC